LAECSLHDLIYKPHELDFKWNLRKKVYVMLQVAKALAAFLNGVFPQATVIHSDIHARNILVLNKKKLEIVVGDFGLSKTIQNPFSQKTVGLSVTDGRPLSKFSAFSTAYIPVVSPEVLSRGEFSHVSDVFSFAVLCYQVMTQEEIYSEWSVDRIVKAIAEGQRLETSHIHPDQLATLICSCWKASRKERPDAFSIMKQLETIFLTTCAIQVKIARVDSPSDKKPLLVSYWNEFGSIRADVEGNFYRQLLDGANKLFGCPFVKVLQSNGRVVHDRHLPQDFTEWINYGYAKTLFVCTEGQSTSSRGMIKCVIGTSKHVFLNPPSNAEESISFVSEAVERSDGRLRPGKFSLSCSGRHHSAEDIDEELYDQLHALVKPGITLYFEPTKDSATLRK